MLNGMMQQDEDTTVYAMPVGQSPKGVPQPVMPPAADEDATVYAVPDVKPASAEDEVVHDTTLMNAGVVVAPVPAPVVADTTLLSPTTGEGLPEKAVVGPMALGTRLHNGEFEIVEVIGAGGFGITYRAKNTRLKIDVVIKENFPAKLATRMPDQAVRSMREGTEGDPYAWTLENFLKEAQQIAALGAKKVHPNIVNVMSFFTEKNTAYYVMRYVQGKSLSAQKPWTEAALKSVLLGLLSGLQFLHENGVLHLDIKPSNVLLQEDGNPVLIDFGAARNSGQGDDVLVYSKGYAPPEQWKGQEYGEVGPWSDLYALGATMYHMITGAKPGEQAEFLSTHAERYPAFSREFLYSIDKALCVSLSDRWQSAQEWVGWYEMRQRLEEAARQEQENIWRQEQSELIQKLNEVIAVSKQASQDQESAFRQQIDRLNQELERAKARRDEEIAKKIQQIKDENVSSVVEVSPESPKSKWSFLRAFISCMKRYVQFSGRACRLEFWWFMLACMLLFTGVALVNYLLAPWVLLVLGLPILTVSVRRFHDVGLPGWLAPVNIVCAWVWHWPLIILVGIALIVGKPGPNRYGATPLPPA